MRPAIRIESTSAGAAILWAIFSYGPSIAVGSTRADKIWRERESGNAGNIRLTIVSPGIGARIYCRCDAYPKPTPPSASGYHQRIGGRVHHKASAASPHVLAPTGLSQPAHQDGKNLAFSKRKTPADLSPFSTRGESRENTPLSAISRDVVDSRAGNRPINDRTRVVEVPDVGILGLGLGLGGEGGCCK